MNLLITGATGGIGEALIEIFYKNNWNIFAVGRNEKILNNLKEKYGEKIKTYKKDLSKDEEINSLLEEIRNIDIDLLINGAGIGELDSFENISIEKEISMLNLNIKALLILTKYFYKEMKKRKKGGIINISSTAGFQIGGAFMVGYYATKSYVNSLTFGLIGENDNENIKIMLLCPGPTATNFKGMSKELKGIKKFYVTTAEEVAKQCYKDFLLGKNLSICGKINKILYYINNFIPWKIQLKNIKKIQLKKWNTLKKR